MKSQSGDASESNNQKPYCMIGAGNLTSSVWKIGDEQQGWRYRFNIYRTTRRDGRVSHLMRSQDIKELVKLVQVITAVISEDGCVTPEERMELTEISITLDNLLGGPGNLYAG